MTISWTDAAIEAAIRGWFDTDDAFRPRMRAALDAAVKAQQIAEIKRDYPNAAAQYRADALEEAASICPCRGNEIRALKEKKGVT